MTILEYLAIAYIVASLGAAVVVLCAVWVGGRARR